MHQIHLQDLSIPEDRIRKEFNSSCIKELAESIESVGLIHAPVLRDDGFTLVAGENRVRAMELLHTQGREFTYQGETLPEYFIPYTRLCELDSYHAKLAELEENVRRTNLTWQEEAQARAALHETYVQKNPKHTMRETAEAIIGDSLENKGGSMSNSIVKDSITLTQNMDKPEVSKAKSRKDALKAIKKEQAAMFRSALAESASKNIETEHSILHGDARQVLRTLPTGHFACICTDPPYGMGAHDFGDQAENAHVYDDSYESWLELMQEVMPELYRVASEQAHAYVFCTFENWKALGTYMQDAGWWAWPRPLIWSKGYNSMLPRPELGPHYSYECILYAIKGSRPVTYRGGLDVIEIPRGRDLRHAAEKPAELYRNLLERTVEPHDHILDAFAGSGPIVDAARSLHCIATAIEAEQANVDMIWDRVAAHSA